jgi:hypothetical protein
MAPHRGVAPRAHRPCPRRRDGVDDRPRPGDVLRDAQLFRVDADAAFALLTLLGQARPQPALPAPSAGSTSSIPPLAGLDDVVTVDDWSADATPAPGDGPTRAAPTSSVVAEEVDRGEVDQGVWGARTRSWVAHQR